MHLGRSWNLRKEFSKPRKSWKITVVMKSYGKVMEFHQCVMEFFNTRNNHFKSSAIKLKEYKITISKTNV